MVQEVTGFSHQDQHQKQFQEHLITNGDANTGGGGGGLGGPTSRGAGAGGKGIVIIRYKFQ